MSGSVSRCLLIADESSATLFPALIAKHCGLEVEPFSSAVEECVCKSGVYAWKDGWEGGVYICEDRVCVHEDGKCE